MEYGHILVQLVVSYILIDIVHLIISNSNRKKIIKKNNKLDELRSKPFKTIEEQKKFIDEKFGKILPWKFGLEFWWNFFWNLFIFSISYLITGYVINLLNLHITLFWGIVVLIILPLLFNFILRKYKLHKSNSLMDILR